MHEHLPAKTTPQLPHHSLYVWHRGLALVRFVHQHPIGDAELRSQAERAVRSVLNIAEGAAHEGARRRQFFKIARGSVAEVVAAYELAEAIGETLPVAEVTEQGRILCAMLTRLVR